MIDTILATAFTIFAQVMVKVQPIWDRFKVLISIALGVAIGLVIGWGILPVKWTNATAGHLREDYRAYYLATVAEEYVQTNDMATVANRLGLDLDINNRQKRNIPWLKNPKTLDKQLTGAVANAQKYNLNANKTIALQRLSQDMPQIRNMLKQAQPKKANTLQALGIIVGGLVVVGLIVTAIWFLLMRNRKAAEPESETYTPVGEEEELTYEELGGATPPVKSFTTTYVLGDDYFDPSFSIEIGPDFLGECGIGISETIGAGDPKKVTAFEGWLFDKSDIRTVTTVLASEYAVGEADLRAKLEPKGNIEQISAGQEITLETTALRVQVRIKELEHAQGNLPTHSYIQKATFELRAWVKATDEKSEPAAD